MGDSWEFWGPIWGQRLWGILGGYGALFGAVGRYWGYLGFWGLGAVGDCGVWGLTGGSGSSLGFLWGLESSGGLWGLGGLELGLV